jgi:hypothetical protein
VVDDTRAMGMEKLTEEDYYKILGVSKSASEQEINKGARVAHGLARIRACLCLSHTLFCRTQRTKSSL